MRKLEDAVLHSYQTGEIVGYKTVTVLPTGRVIKLDTGIQGHILSDANSKSSTKVTPQTDKNAKGETTILSLNRKFAPIFQDNPLVINAGGRASGKTYASACASVIETYKKKRNILILRFNKSSVKDSIYAEIVKLIERFDLLDDFKIEANQIVNETTGSKLLFKGIKSSSLDVRDTLKGIIDLSTVVIEEAADLDKDFDEVLELLRGTMRTKGFFYRVHIILNPRSKNHNIYKRFVAGLEIEHEYCGEHNGAYLISSSYKDNPALPKQFIKGTIEFLKANNPEVYEHVYEGRWKNQSKGQIIKRFRTGEYREVTPTILGIDLGYRDETAGLMVSIDEDSMKCYVKLVLFANEVTSDDLVVQLAPYNNYNMVLDSARPEIIESLKRSGFKALPCKKGAGSVLDGITKMTAFEIIVDPENSAPVLEAFNNYSWKKGC
jgi:phage terminase large subunit